jgi:hypothetical protein
MDVTEAGGVIQTGENVFLGEAGEGIQDVIEAVPGAEMGQDGANRDPGTTDDRFSVANVWKCLDAIHSGTVERRSDFVNGDGHGRR